MAINYLGDVRIFAGNYPPRGWEFCDGRLLAIADYPDLYSVLGTRWGGDGITTFALPDLRRFAMGWDMGAGPAPGLSSRALGEQVGSETVTLTAAQIPPHRHQVGLLSEARAVDNRPGGNVYGKADVDQYAPAAEPGPALEVMAPVGGGEPHENLSPWLGVSFIIAVE